MRHRLVAAVFSIAAAQLACSDPTSSGTGRAEALIQDTPTGTGTISGSLAGNVFASISANGNTWVNLGSPNGITVPLQLTGTTSTVHGEADAAAGTYSRVRLTFDGVVARLQAGSVVGGVTLTSDANITLGGADQRVELTVTVPSFAVDADPSVQRTVLFELRSHLWLTAAALQAGTVEDAALQAAVQATTRLDPR
jgi:hypothetical protein